MIILIAAVAQNNVIGSKNDLPWYLPEDLKHFKELTTGHIVLMGRKTYESIANRLGKPLPNRKNIVITHQKDFLVPPEVEVYLSVGDALAAHPGENIYIIGGAQIFAQTIDQADKLEITHVFKDYPGDVYFPKINEAAWKKTAEQINDSFSFVTYERIR